MGYSNVELANRALNHIGKANIASLTENSEAARKINAILATDIGMALSRQPWTFNRKFETLANVTNDWSERWTYKYDEPNDAAFIVRLVPPIDLPNALPVKFQRLGGKIYTNEPDAKAEYVYKSTTTLSMPDMFLDAVAFLIARDVSMPLTKKRQYWKDLNEAYEIALMMAAQIDAGQEPNEYPYNGAGGYVDDRGGSSDRDYAPAADGSIYWTT